MAKSRKPYQPMTGERCSCKRGIERDNCPACEGTGMRIAFKAIRDRKPAEQWPTYRPTDTDALIAAKMAERANAGLKVTLTDTGWVGYFATTASRDEFVARAKAKGRSVQIG